MLRPALETLDPLFSAYPALFEEYLQSDALLVTRAELGPYLKHRAGKRNILYQTFWPHAHALNTARFPSVQSIDFGTTSFSLSLPTKQKKESLYLLARAVASLSEGGTCVVACENDLGGKSYRKELFALLGEGDSYSKNHCVVAWAKKNASCDGKRLEELLSYGGLHKIEGTDLVSQAGVFGHDKIDSGSALLVNNLPDTLKGHGADFGCGYGFLSYEALKRAPHIGALDLFESEKRAIDAAELNLAKFASATKLNYRWCDLTLEKEVPPYQFILMNPPHHREKELDSDLGVRFIKKAHTSLAPEGTLYAVVASHLPYRETLNSLFSNVRVLQEQSGFSVYSATK